MVLKDRSIPDLEWRKDSSGRKRVEAWYEGTLIAETEYDSARQGWNITIREREFITTVRLVNSYDSLESAMASIREDVQKALAEEAEADAVDLRAKEELDRLFE